MIPRNLFGMFRSLLSQSADVSTKLTVGFEVTYDELCKMFARLSINLINEVILVRGKI